MQMEQAFQSLNYLAIIAATLSTFLIGGLWYSPILFGNAWMKANGFKAEDLAGGAAKAYIGTFVLAFIGAFNLALFLAGPADVAWGISAGILVGLGWVATSVGIIYLFERKPLSLFFINAGYQIVAFAVMGAILGAWK